MVKKIGLLFVLGLVYLPVLGQSIVNYESYFDNYLVRTLDTEDGMPGQSVFYTHEDSEGFIWIANINGLVRYDGLSLRNFSSGYRGGTLYEIYEDENGDFYIPSIGQGIYRFNGDSLIQYKDELPTDNGFVKSLSLTKSGLIYLGLYGVGLSVFDGEKVVKTYTSEDGLISSEFWSIIEDSEGRLWIGTNEGLSIYENGTFTNFTTENGLPYNTIRGITEMSNGDVWIGTDREGIVIFRDYEPVEYIHVKDGLSGAFPQYFAEHPIDGSVWIAHHGTGLDRYFNGTIENLTKEDGLISNYLTYVGFGKDGTAYVGHETGMSVLTEKRVRVIDDKTPGIIQPAITTVIEDGNGTTWLGSDGNGFYYSDGNEWKVFENPPEYTNGYASAATIDNNGDLWMTTQGTGVVKIVDDKVVLHLDSDSEVLDDFSRGIVADDQNNIWIGTNLGISVVNQKGEIITEYTTENGLANNFTITMMKDSKGRIWHGSYGGGVTVFNENQITTYNSSNGIKDDQVFSLFEYSNGDIFIGTMSSGFSYFDGDQLHYFGAEHGLPTGTVSGMEEDQNGNIWCATVDGIYRFHPLQLQEVLDGSRETIEFTLLTQEDGLPTNEMEPAAGQTIERLSNGEIIFASLKGVTVINPSELSIDTESFFPYIDQFIVDEAPLSLTNTRNLTPEDKKIEISYSALNIKAPKKTKFRIKLDGVDDDWVYVENRTTAYYDFLPDGEYAFHVSAIGPDGQWSNKTASLSFTVLPPFYKTWWFIGFCLMGFAGMVAGSVQWRNNAKVRALNRELAYQQKIQQERERISRDLHDNVGSQITNIITGIEISNMHIKNADQDKASKFLETLDVEARNTMTDLRETIWLLDKEEVAMHDFLTHLKGYVNRQKRFSTHLAIEIKAQENIYFIFNPTESLNLMRIIQEALNNTRKYAQASTFEINIAQTDNGLNFTLKDDGIGMVVDEKIGKGNGLKNMHERVALIGAQLTIVSQQGEGTQLTVVLPG